MAAVVTVGIAGASYAAMNPRHTERQARAVADRATCQTVNTAIVAYVAANDRGPETIAQLKDLVRGDISAYRIVDGMAAGPGC
jgi:hypothetical protein